MARAVAVLIPLVFSLTISDAAVAKGPLAKIALDAPGFESPIQVTSGEALLTFNPWAQRFLGAPRDTAPLAGTPGTVTLYLRDESGEVQPVYRFTYFRTDDHGSIYLPGPADPDYDLNKVTILDGNGRWYHASPEWDVFFSQLLLIRPPSTGTGGLK